MGSQGKPSRDNTPDELVSKGTESVATFPEDHDDGGPRFPDIPPGTLIAGRYGVRAMLGRGGYAVVYSADDRLTGAAIALKVLRDDRLGRVALKRLAREAETAKQFQHERLVKVLDSGTTGDNAFLVMELVDGQTLRARRQEGPLATNEAVDIARDVLEALAALHKAGVVHRDVKPSNILLDRNGRAKLADFGLVTRWNDDQSKATQSHAIVGTVEYVSPEQALGEDLDGRSDLYSLGVVLFEMLSGAPLHGTRSSLGTLVAHLTKAAPDVRATRENVPDWLAAVVARLLEKDRTLRYPSAEAVLGDLAERRGPRRATRLSLPRMVAAAVITVASLAVFLAWLGVGRPAAFKPPALVAADVKGGRLRGLDENGDVLWTKGFPLPLDDARFGPPRPDEEPRLKVFDLEGDGSNEVLLVAVPAEGQLAHLYVFGADGSERFRRRPGRPVVYGAETYDTFNAHSVHAFVDPKGNRRFFLLSQHLTWFPSVLEELDPRGDLIGDYYAAGTQLFFGRLSLDGREVIALSGFHNETRGGSLTLLDMDRPFGRAPALNKAYSCGTCEARDPLTIIVVPKSDVLRAQAGADGSVHTHRAVLIDNSVIDLPTRHGPYMDPVSGAKDMVVSYRISADLRTITDLTPSHAFQLGHDLAFKGGQIDHSYGPRDLEALKKVVKWDGRGWAPMPFSPAAR